MSDQTATESPDEIIARLTESNRRLANQIVGYGDRMQQTIAGIRRDAKVEALREATEAWWIEADGGKKFDAWKWLKDRADNLEGTCQ